MAESIEESLKKVQVALEPLAPHSFLKMLLQPLIPKEPAPAPAPAQQSAQLALQAQAAQQAEMKPWTAATQYSRDITDRPVEQRLMGFHRQNQPLIGETWRAGVITETKDDNLVLVGLGNMFSQVPGEVYSPKTETKPMNFPFAMDRKSGEQYWKDEPRKVRVTQIF